MPKLELFRERVSELSHIGIDILTDPWPELEDKRPVRLTGRGISHYTEESVLQRTNDIFNGALRIYNNIVERRLPAFNTRNQMRHMLPFRMKGELVLPEYGRLNGPNEAYLLYWNEWADDTNSSGIFIELGSMGGATNDDIRGKIQAAQEKFVAQGMPYYNGIQALPIHGARPATELAHEWLTQDLKYLNWV